MTTTNPLDGLLAIRNGFPTARWNFPDAVGTSASSPGGTGDGAEVTFSFLTAVPGYYSGSGFSTAGFKQFSDQQKQAVRDVLSFYSDVINLNFTEVASSGNMSFGLNDQAGSSGFGFFPGFGYSTLNGTISSVTMTDLGGDVWMNGSKAWTATDFSLGGAGYGGLVHEVGHALGLKHPFFEASLPNASILDPSLNSTQYTVMAYAQHPFSLYRTVTETSSGYSTDYQPILPETLMPLDIQALQYLYGANTSFHVDDDTYTFDTDRPFIKTLYDAGGNDTISVANFSLGCVLDLTDGHYSSISIPSGALPPGAVENNPGIYDGTDNLAIAYGTVIENATGGTGNDQLLGNAVANILNGGVGSDTMQGGDGSDIYYVDNKNDRVTETNATAATGGVDLVNSYLNTYTLGANIENGAVLATGAANLTGNGLDNTLYAGAGNNTLNGGARTDTVSYASAATAVTVSLASTGAQATGGSGSDTLIGIENLVGSINNDTLTGNTGNNVLDGGLGNDILAGGAGNDTYVINVAADRVKELSGQGTDTIMSTISYSLVDTDGSGSNGGNVENLSLTGSDAINGTGNGLNNTLTGNGAANILTGNAGNDKLVGGAGTDQLIGGSGQDTLTGNSGADLFKFNFQSETGVNASTCDIITDFSRSQGDKVDLSSIDANTAFKGNNAFSAPTVGGAFSGEFANPGELYFDQIAHILYGNTDADSAANFSILLTGVSNLVAADFVL
ncbi:MAG: M10 family metallopeptidase C-terminal domain-containing protein [Methylobacter sp.]|nr:M10 family metallopeptidase C-terminal domain-containing protein [Methylobacter sp.]